MVDSLSKSISEIAETAIRSCDTAGRIQCDLLHSRRRRRQSGHLQVVPIDPDKQRPFLGKDERPFRSRQRYIVLGGECGGGRSLASGGEHAAVDLVGERGGDNLVRVAGLGPPPLGGLELHRTPRHSGPEAARRALVSL
jgi:hypothetical protein